jgi:hypothetical protein
MYDHLPLVLGTKGAFFISLNLLQSNNLSKFCEFLSKFQILYDLNYYKEQRSTITLYLGFNKPNLYM